MYTDLLATILWSLLSHLAIFCQKYIFFREVLLWPPSNNAISIVCTHGTCGPEIKAATRDLAAARPFWQLTARSGSIGSITHYALRLSLFYLTKILNMFLVNTQLFITNSIQSPAWGRYLMDTTDGGVGIAYFNVATWGVAGGKTQKCDR